MRKKAKSMELVTAPLTWCDSTGGGEAIKGEGGKMGEER